MIVRQRSRVVAQNATRIATPRVLRIGSLASALFFAFAPLQASAQIDTTPAPAPPILIWTNGGRPTPAALVTIVELGAGAARGLDTSRYDADQLALRASRMTAAADAGTPWSADSLTAFERDLTTRVTRFATDLSVGRVDPRTVSVNLSIADKQRALSGIAERVARAGNIAALFDSLEPPYEHYRVLKEALRRYRAMPPDSAKRVRQIELTMERWRWLPRFMGDRFIVVNVPGFRLYAFDLRDGDRSPKLTMPVVVGQAARTPTPIFTGTMQYVVFRPYWNVPPGITRNETLPKLRRNPGSLTRDRLEIVAANAPDSPTTTYPATAANLSRVASGALRIRQTPGPHNALGAVKFMFPNRYDVYLHDTPSQSLFEKDRRDFSHGCIRVANPPALAEFILGEQGWSEPAIDSAMKSGPLSRRVTLSAPIDVYVMYGTVLAELDGSVQFYSDVYKLDAVLERALARQK